MSDDIRTQVDRQGRRFIAAVQYLGGEATMTEIRHRTGLSRAVADWRFRKLDDLDLIDVSYAKTGRGDRDPPRVATLTGTARAEIERGLLFDIDRDRSKEEINDLAAEIQSLREDVERIEQKVDAGAEELHWLNNDIDDIHDWADDIEAFLGGLRDAIQDGIPVNEALRTRLD